jgi:hypothetical protein
VAQLVEIDRVVHLASMATSHLDFVAMAEAMDHAALEPPFGAAYVVHRIDRHNSNAHSLG